ncbi:MAG: hypothetical protein WC975_05440 [Phycisphaerae bacterium]
MKRTLLFTAGILGPMCGLLAGCDDNVKSTVLTGLQGGATTVATALITALFQTAIPTTTAKLVSDLATSLVAVIL